MVPRCSTTCRAEYRRVMPSNRGLSNHRAVSPTSESVELMACCSVTCELYDPMTCSCYAAARLWRPQNPGPLRCGSSVGRSHQTWRSAHEPEAKVPGPLDPYPPEPRRTIDPAAPARHDRWTRRPDPEPTLPARALG